jgi:hypothetical protein
MSKKYIIKGFEKIFYIGGKGVLLFLMQVMPFRIDDFLKSFRHIRIVWRNQARFELRT